MGVIYQATTTTGLTNAATNAETAVFTTPVLPSQGQGLAAVSISGYVNITAGTGTTAVVVRVRQGSGVTGTIVSALAASDSLAAGAVESIPFGVTDTSTYLESGTGGQYTITVQQTGGTGNGTTNAIDIEVLV